MKVGYVAILGRPNVGKSSLLNALLSKRVSIVSPRAQTTRDAISGILNEKGSQIVFVDTPGLFQGEGKLDSYMKRSAFSSVKGVDAIVYILDASEDNYEEDYKTIGQLKQQAPLIILFNKIDLISAEEGMKKKEDIAAHFPDCPIIEASIKENFGLKEVKAALLPHLVEGEPFYPENILSDKDKTFEAREVIREKMLHFLSQEVPHQAAVKITHFSKSDAGYLIEATLILNKKSHLGIVIGKSGSMIKKISMAARQELEQRWHERVASLILQAEAVPSWRNDPKILQELGYAIGRD